VGSPSIRRCASSKTRTTTSTLGRPCSWLISRTSSRSTPSPRWPLRRSSRRSASTDRGFQGSERASAPVPDFSLRMSQSTRSNAGSMPPEGTAQQALPLVLCRRIVKEYPGVTALDGVDFELRAGEVHVLFGENGAGKSTLISLLAGAQSPTSGEILVRGQPVQLDSVQRARGLGISAVFQEFS